MIPAVALSIVIPTYNRADTLPDCLRALMLQDFRDYETLVVDNGPSTDHTAQVMRQVTEEDSRFRHITTTERGDFVARDYGCSSCRAPLVLTLDDDWIMEDLGTLAYITACFQKMPLLGVLGISEYYPDGRARGKSEPAPVYSRLAYLKEPELFFPGRISRWGGVGNRFHYLSMNALHPVDHVRSSCMAFRRAPAEKIGFFPDFYVENGDGFRSETELCRHFARQGYSICYSTEKQGLHRVAPRAPGTIPRSRTPQGVRHRSRNHHLFMLRNYWTRLDAVIFFVWDVLVGIPDAPGLLRYAQKYYRERPELLKKALAGKWQAFKDYYRLKK